MNAMIIFYVSAILFLLWYFLSHVFQRNLVYTKSSIDQRYYLVRNLSDRIEAANLLASIRKLLMTLCSHLYKLYPMKKKIQLLQKRFNPNHLQESEERSLHTSYSINKGQNIIFCLRSKDASQTLIDKNILIFVALHELAHVMTVSVGHTSEFWENFRFLLAHAITMHMYQPVDFKENPVPYCGTYITDTPLQLKDIPKYIEFNDAQKEEIVKEFIHKI